MQPLKPIHILSFLLALFVTACSDIDEADRLIYVKPDPVGRKVLIEDFTGQRCVNCPTATLEIEKLQEFYGADTVIAVGIHSGPFAKTLRGVPYSLHTAVGDEYYNYWKVESQPMGVIDRTGTCDYNLWGSVVREEVVKSAPLSMEAECIYNEATREAFVNCYGRGVDGHVAGKLQIWLIEDGIIDFQFMPDGSRDNEYVHNHVLRCAVNGTWGTDITVDEGEAWSDKCSYILNEAWKPENMSVVAFVYDERGVCQVTKSPLKPLKAEPAEN